MKEMENIFKYVRFYDYKKEEIITDSELQIALIQYCYTEETKNKKYYSTLLNLAEILWYVHVSEDIPTEFEKDIEKFLCNFCNDILEITRFDFAKGITYFYKENGSCFTNTVYETEQIEKQLEFLTKLKNFD